MQRITTYIWCVEKIAMSQTEHPRNEYEHKPSVVDELYEDRENGKIKRVVYRDDFVVVLRADNENNTNETTDATQSYTHEVLREDTFVNKQVRGELQHKPNTTSDIPKANNKIVSEAKELWSNEDELDNRTEIGELKHSGDKMSNVTEEDTTESTDTVSEKRGVSKPKEPWSTVKFVGENIEQRLYDNGFETKADIRITKEEELRSIAGISERTAKNLKAYALEDETVEDWSELEFIGDALETRLHEHGFETKADIQNADINKLKSVDRMGEKTIASLVDYATQTGIDGGESDTTASDSDENTERDDTDWEDWRTVKYVGDFVMGQLYDHGFKTVGDVYDASDDELAEVPQLGTKAMEKVKQHAESRKLNDMTSSTATPSA